MLSLAFLLIAIFANDDPSEILRRTAKTYENLKSFELSKSLTIKVPGQDIIVSFQSTQLTEIYANSIMLPADSPVPVLESTVVKGFPVYLNSAGQEVQAKIAGYGVSAFTFSALSAIDKRVVSARLLPDETLVIKDETVPCTVVEVLYEKSTNSNRGYGQPVRFWIEKRTSFVRQVSYQGELRKNEMAQCTARVEKMTVDQPPPEWAINFVMKKPEAFKGREETKWIGQEIPDLTLKTLDGKNTNLTELRGRVVLLDFWATWCGPCQQEMLILERLRDELKTQGIEIWGVTDEPPDVASKWLAERNRTLPTLIDTDHTLFRHYAIEAIPVLIVLRPDGKISNFVVGLRNERDLRADIAKAK